MDNLINKIILHNDIEDIDKDLFTKEFYKYIGGEVKERIKLNKVLKKFDDKFRSGIKEQNDKYEVAYSKYKIELDTLKKDIDECQEVLKEEIKIRGKINELSYKWNMSKKKINNLAADNNISNEFAEKWIKMIESKKRLKILQRHNSQMRVGENPCTHIILKSKTFCSNDTVIIDNIDTWKLSYDGYTYSEDISVKYHIIKQLEQYGWDVKLTTHTDKEDVECGCWGFCDCPPIAPIYINIYYITLKPVDEN